ncbi:hypothetical protein [Mycolicibacterium aichiense]|uniref:Uncharacterized protein n=1 Tax=Mycolicibacterium aichiense TaxID=1799 RepID=A0AAD1HT42_9MYCO|nr:hypothetical protein [Mycolicibacterium aichiense]MCV7017008.1 hypothetical protein [Mycolicibacterium aichiense]BBX10565.1 hypothetical protein MAIC_53680 [Mycolicibacterium aichiense]STZ25777.1 Conserved membrane protein of uncharacterised function [Mycolicibacterium aichiense]
MTDRVELLVSQIDAALPTPAIVRRDVALVAGPWLAGTSSVATALRERLPEHTVVEAEELAAGHAPAAVVFVVSATAPLTESDCALLDSVAADTDAVIGVVAKIDVHRTWRDVLDADRVLLARRAPRYRDMRWVGTAAAPDLGAPVIDDLVTALRELLTDETRDRRNRLRAIENRLLGVHRRLELDAVGTGRDARLAALRAERAAAVHRYRVDKSQRSIALRAQIAQARLALTYFARNRCASVRTELQEDLAGLSRRDLARFPDEVRRRAEEVADDVAAGVTRHLADVGEELGLVVEPVHSRPAVEVGAAPSRARGAETRLMLLLGGGFGFGAALTLSRVFADLAPQWAVGGALGGAVIGVVLTVWVVGVRGLLHDRAVLDRWVVQVVGRQCTAVEEWVGARVLAAEASLGGAAAERDAADHARTEDTIARIDREIREHATAGARAAAARDRHVPVIESALAAVREELGAIDTAKQANSRASESFL